MTSTGQHPASVDMDTFRAVMGSLPSGVCVVTSVDDEGRPQGLTCSAVCSVSGDPPMLLACVKAPSRTLDAILARKRFAVNFLDADAQAVSALFASPVEDKFGSVAWDDASGMPQLRAAVATAQLIVHDTVQAGDHVIVLGRMVEGEAHRNRFPLGYWRGSYVRVFRIARV
ncbi:flavin reductase family protein [Catellatospora bangladeshensis]|uniref:flavin reductase family protein n=1 Tax=Catellatospora bangladeshensis TaxID=310355 RepID=UPI001941E424|nr:flavin reductase family protein [Catellatospora bangladeshensis]